MDNGIQRVSDHKYHSERPLKTLFFMVWPDRWRLSLSAVFFIIKHSPVWLMPFYVADVVDMVTNPTAHSPARLWIETGLMMLIFMQNAFTNVIYARGVNHAVRRLEMELRHALVRRLQQLSIAFHDDSMSGKLHAKLLRDVENVQIFCAEFIRTVLEGSLNILIAIGVTIYGGRPELTLFYLVAIPMAVLVSRPFKGVITKYNRLYRCNLEEMSSRLGEMVAMMPVTRAHGIEEVEIAAVTNHIRRVRESGYKLDVTYSFFGALMWVSLQTPTVLCLGLVGYLGLSGKVTPGEITLYASYFAMMLGGILMFINQYPAMLRGIESVKSIGEVLECPDIEDNEGKSPVVEVTGEFRFEHVRYQYSDGSPALDDINLHVRAGETIAIVGESGSGKSTLMSLIIGFRRPTGGKIHLDGRDMSGLDLRGYRHRLAVVPQNNVLFSGSILENITFGMGVTTGAMVAQAVEAANAAEFIERMPKGLRTKVGEHGAKLSGGQRQRVAIARAIIRDPRVIVLDEATSALDVVSEKLVQEAIDRLARNRTTFIVAHRLSTVRNADRVVVMKNGRIVECGTYAELLAGDGEFAQLKRLQR